MKLRLTFWMAAEHLPFHTTRNFTRLYLLPRSLSDDKSVAITLSTFALHLQRYTSLRRDTCDKDVRLVHCYSIWQWPI